MPYSDSEKQREYQREWIARRRAEWVKSNGPCADCGTWEDLEIDHVDASTKVTHRVWSWSRRRREEELAKCVVRCGPCHDIKTTTNGERHWGVRLTNSDVLAIRASTATLRDLAKQYGVSPSTIYYARSGQSWKHISSD